MKKLLSILILTCLLLSLLLTSCTDGLDSNNPGENGSSSGGSSSGTETASVGDKVEEELTEIPEESEGEVSLYQVTCLSGTETCYTYEDDVITFTEIQEDTSVAISGNFDGSIKIDTGDEYSFELVLTGFTLYAKTDVPISCTTTKKVTITAKKDTKNFIYDTRDAITDEEDTKACVFAEGNLDLGGKGSLTIISSNNNGVHTKGNLQINNLTLSVTCQDNALKGNDEIQISGGDITCISKTGDGLKTTNSALSSKGNQKGTIQISGGTTVIYAACDGIDAAYNVEISEDSSVTIYTDTYSPYSEDVTETGDTGDVRYIRFNYQNYSYSVKYYNSDSDYKWVNATYYKSVSSGRSTYYYYTIEKCTSYSQVAFFIYSSDQTQGQETEYVAKSDYMTWNTAYDTFALEARGTSLTYYWTNYGTESSMGGMGGIGGMSDGNQSKSDYSTKGIKAANEIQISGGTISVTSYDDALHTNSDGTLESGETPTGAIYISGGTLTLFSKDDGIHAEGTLTVSGGTIEVTNCYEGLEGVTIKILGGNISVVSSDDGFNSTTTSGEGIIFEDGTVYIYAGGDGIDANSKTSYKGIIFHGGTITVINTSSGNSSIDTEKGYTYTGGTVLALCPSGAMTSEPTYCSNFSSVGTSSRLSLKQNQVVYVQVSGTTTIQVTMPCALTAFAVYLGSSSASFKTK